MTTGPTPVPRRGSDERARILVVDDDRDTVELLAMLLRATGRDVEVATDAAAALRIAAAFAPHVALLDIGLPGMDGFELAHALHCAHPATRLVAVTGHGLEADAPRARAAGFASWLLKPVSHEMLEAALRELLDAG